MLNSKYKIQGSAGEETLYKLKTTQKRRRKTAQSIAQGKIKRAVYLSCFVMRRVGVKAVIYILMKSVSEFRKELYQDNVRAVHLAS